MNRQAAFADDGAGVGKGAVAAIVVVSVALALLLIVRARPGPEPFDPRSSAPDGATGLVELLERSGADVDITRTPPAPGDGVRMLVMLDKLDDAQRSATFDFVRSGGIVVVADPDSTLHGGPGADGGSTTISGGFLPNSRRPVDVEANLRPGICTIGALAELRGLYVPDGLLFPVGPDALRCFGDGDRSFVVVEEFGAGRIVGLGDNEVFVNRELRRADNAGLATALLVPAPASAPTPARVVILLGVGAPATVADVGSGDDTLFDLVPNWVWMAIVLGAIGFVVFAVSRSVRIGKVLDEPLPTPIAGSELVAATGNLMQRAKHSIRAGWLLQSQLRRDLCRNLNLDPQSTPAEIDHAVSTRAGTAPGTVETLLAEQTHNDAQLLALSSRIDRLRREVLT